MKKFISVMLVAAMAVTALTGCGSNSGSSSKKDADKYYIGGIGPTTGATAIYGTAVKNGAQIAVDEINAAGGINGKQIEYRFEDDQNDAEKAVNAYNTLKDWGMQMLVGTTTTNSSACPKKKKTKSIINTIICANLRAPAAMQGLFLLSFHKNFIFYSFEALFCLPHCANQR